MSITVYRLSGYSAKYYKNKSNGRFLKLGHSANLDRIYDLFMSVELKNERELFDRVNKSRYGNLLEDWELVVSSFLLNFLIKRNEIEKGSLELKDFLTGDTRDRFVDLINDKYRRFVHINLPLQNSMFVLEELRKTRLT